MASIATAPEGRSHDIRLPLGRASASSTALFVVVTAPLFMPFVLPVRFTFPLQVGIDLWLAVQFALDVLLAVFALRFLFQCRALTKYDVILVLFLFYTGLVLVVTAINYGALDAVQGLRVYWLPASLYFLGRWLSAERDAQILLVAFIVVASVISLFYVVDFLYFFVLAGEPLSAMWTETDYAWTVLRPDRIGGWTGGVFGYPHPNGVFAAAGLVASMALLTPPGSRRGKLAGAGSGCSVPTRRSAKGTWESND